jgi:signal transduction histidine kinase
MASRQTSRARRLAVDVGVAAVAFFLTLGATAGDDGGAPHAGRDIDPLAILLIALSTLPLLARRRTPLGVFAVTAAASSLLYGLDYPPGPPLGPTVALFSLGLHPPAAGGRVTAAVVAGFFALHIAAAGIGNDEFPVVPALLGSLLWGGAWVIGDRARMRRERIRRGEEEAERELRVAVAEERTRIARDLHDSAGHALNVILVQAGAARLLSERDPDRARTSLETIEEVARETVGEIDRLVHVLREQNASEPVAPPVGLAALDTLVERHRAAGLDVTVQIEGEPRPLPRAVDQAAYRIVQEALTNAGRHGDGRADVRLELGPRALRLAIANPATGPPGQPGHGIAGMRERAELLGGRLDAGHAGGTFLVAAELPYGREEQ